MLAFDRDPDIARFPMENPNPVLRVAADGRILFANRASEILLESWGLWTGDCLPAPWETKLREMLTSGQRQRTSVCYQERVYELDMVPIAARGYVNIYARDITEQEAASQAREESLVELATERARLAELAEGLSVANEQLSQREAELSDAVSELRRARDELDARVLERTAELSQANTALRKSEASFRAIFETSRLGMAMVGSDGRVLKANPSLRHMLGYNEHELRAMAFTRFSLPDDLDNDLALFHDLLTGKRDSYQLEKRFIRKDGQVIWGHLTGSMARDSGGEPLFGVGMLDDITEHKRFEQQLELQSLMLAQVSDALIASDDQARIVYWNQAAECLYGLSAEQAVGQKLDAAYTCHWLTPEDEQAAETALATTGQWHGECVHTLRDGRELFIDASMSALRDNQGQACGLLAAIRDITRRKQGQLEVAASRERLRNLSRHLVQLQEGERQYVARQLYDDEGQRLAALLLGLHRIENDPDCSQAVGAQVTELKELADGVLEDLHSLAVNLRPACLDKLGLVPALRQYADQFGRDHGIAMQVELAALSRGRLAREAETLLYRIVQDALSNVAQHAHAGRVDLIGCWRDNRLVIVIEDYGCGFDVAATLDAGALGLLGMQERAEMLGGELHVESTPGAGTAVYIAVPFET